MLDMAPNEGPDELVDLEADVAALRQELANIALIGQATGIIMAERRCSPEDAQALLGKTAEECGVPVRELAELLVRETCGGVRLTFGQWQRHGGAGHRPSS